MKLALGFRGDVDRLPYLAGSAAALLSQLLIACALFVASGRPAPQVWWFWLNPLRAIAYDTRLPPWAPIAAMVAVIFIDLVLISLAFRRAQQTAFGMGCVPLVLVPVLQVVVVAFLAALPPAKLPPLEEAVARGSKMRAAMLGLGLGAALCVAAVLISAVVLRVYGYSLFLASPFVIGFTTAIVAARSGFTTRQALGLVMMALAIGGLALVGVALEGVICVILASPIIAGAGLIGAACGLAMMRVGRLGRHTTTLSVAVVPLMMVAEVLLPPRAGFYSVESIEVAASPAAVWDSIVHMGPIPGAPAAPFRWGLAYPMRGVIRGDGVGAVREGVFSTGTAYEKVTVWEPGRRLNFDVLSDPPTMKELSPYAHVNAPHNEGYFRTLYAHFTITPLASGRTQLTLTTRHEVDLEPALYWLPVAEWATHTNKVRVLQHFRDQAERAG